MSMTVAKNGTTIDALFGSKTRVKLLHLFLNNPGKAYYVREITRLIDEQINSVRRELANLLKVGVITSTNADNKLYYEVNQRYEYFVSFRAIFSDDTSARKGATKTLQHSDQQSGWREALATVAGARLIVLAGVLVKGSTSQVDILIAGDVKSAPVKRLIAEIETAEGRDINYVIMSYDDFYYRLSVRDRFVTQIISGKYSTLVDTDSLL